MHFAHLPYSPLYLISLFCFFGISLIYLSHPAFSIFVATFARSSFLFPFPVPYLLRTTGYPYPPFHFPFVTLLTDFLFSPSHSHARHPLFHLSTDFFLFARSPFSIHLSLYSATSASRPYVLIHCLPFSISSSNTSRVYFFNSFSFPQSGTLVNSIAFVYETRGRGACLTDA